MGERYTVMWLVFLAVIAAIGFGTTVMRYSLLRSAVAGAVAGVVVLAVINVISPTDCLQQSKGWRILTAYKVC
jgi:hypothetical protein